MEANLTAPSSIQHDRVVPLLAIGWRQVHAWAKANKEHLSEFMPGYAALADEKHCLGWWSSTTEAALCHTYLSYAIKSAKGEFIGLIEVGEISLHRQTGTIACALAESAQGQGVMESAIREVLSLVMGNPRRKTNLFRVTAYVASNNQRSLNLFKRIGFIQEGTMRQAEKVGNSRVDLTVFGLTLDDLDTKKEGGG